MSGDGVDAALTRRRLLGAVGAVGLVAVSSACGGGDDSADTTSPPTITLDPLPSTTAAPTTTAAATTTTVAATTTTSEAVVARSPLRGTPVPFGFDGTRPAMVVKLDNHPKARPQSGLNVADIVFEENVEGVTRFAAVFHSTNADPVGPIRSGRTQDVDLLASFANPMFVWSGGNARVTDAIRNSGMFQIDQNVGRGIMFRTDRPGPHDLYADMSALYSLRPEWAVPPPPQFVYRADDIAVSDVAGQGAAAVKVSMLGVRALWEWNTQTERYHRETDGVVHTDTLDGEPWSADNVVVLSIEYRPSPADGRSPEAQTVGSGEAIVLTAGKVFTGTWTRDDRLVPFALADADGNTIELTAGRTVVELATAGAAAVVATGTPVADVPFP